MELNPDAFDVVLAGGQLARMPSMLRYPMPPAAPKDKKDPLYLFDLQTYQNKWAQFQRDSQSFIYFSIDTLVCESGSVVNAKVLNFNPYISETRKAVMVSPGVIQIVPSPPAPKKNNQKGGNNKAH